MSSASSMDPAPQRAANERGCYCDGLDAEFRRQHNIPEGYCGTCDRCGQPGHTRHFPGPVPYTGAWCDRCYRIVAWTRPLRNPINWAILIGLAVAFWPILKRLFE